MKFNLFKGDCLELLKDISDNSIDIVLADPPYHRLPGYLKWDLPIDLKKLWKELWRVCKINAPIFLFGDFKFCIHLVNSQPKYFRYEIVWNKNRTTTPLLSRKRFGVCTEYVLVFYKKLPPYHYLKHHKIVSQRTYHNIAKFIGGKKENNQVKVCYKPKLPLNVIEKGESDKGVMKRPPKEVKTKYEPKLPLNVVEEPKSYGGVAPGKFYKRGNVFDPRLPLNVFEEGEETENEVVKGDGVAPFVSKKRGNYWHPNLPLNYLEDKKQSIINSDNCVGAAMDGMDRNKALAYEPRLPLNVVKCGNVCRNKIIKNITEKPQFLLKHILKYWATDGDTCLDFCMGSGSCGIACIDQNVDFIGMEMNADHFEKAKKRIVDYYNNKND